MHLIVRLKCQWPHPVLSRRLNTSARLAGFLPMILVASGVQAGACDALCRFWQRVLKGCSTRAELSTSVCSCVGWAALTPNIDRVPRQHGSLTWTASCLLNLVLTSCVEACRERVPRHAHQGQHRRQGPADLAAGTTASPHRLNRIACIMPSLKSSTEVHRPRYNQRQSTPCLRPCALSATRGSIAAHADSH